MALDSSLSSSVKNGILKELESSMDLESKLSSSPMCLAAMSQLNLVAADAEDFSLMPPGSPGVKVQHVHYPQSFKATVNQVSLRSL